MKKIKLNREQIALEMMKVLVSKSPYGEKEYNEDEKLDENDVANTAARGAVDYADCLLKALKEKPRV